MAITNKSNTSKETKDFWRTSPELVNDALKLLNIYMFDVDICCTSYNEKISKALKFISEKDDALELTDCWFDRGSYSFINPPFSKKWIFFNAAVEVVNKTKKNILMVMPYTPCTKEWHENVHSTNCIIYVPDGRYQYLLPDGTKPKNSCNFETCLVLIVPFKCGNVIVNYKRGL
ncbi:DNA N-6-adenine-methyltransferase [Orbus sturtevantii]|uniref:DNA N-6-adenine-methyltransferase n=1 Tax=Orbus sturtevantii TaxID=3074109 RepID=UPI00370D6893